VTHVFADARVADELAASVDLERGVAAEQVGDLLPLALVDIVAVDPLEIGDREMVLRRACARLDRVEPRLQACDFSFQVECQWSSPSAAFELSWT
jgi:hypothetical protein